MITPVMVGFLLMIVLLVVLAFGWPVSVSLGALGFLGLWKIIGFHPAMSKLVSAVFESMGYDYAVLPLFILMAEVIVVSGIAGNLYDLAAKWLGRLPGGMAIATIAAAGVFAAMSGSALAGVATFAVLAIPEMKRLNYDTALTLGTVCAGGPLSVLIPPSGFLIVYGIISETSISKLFTGGILPGILLVILYSATIFIMCRINPGIGPAGPRYTMKEKLKAFSFTGEVIILIIICVGGIVFGWFTPTEGGAAGAFGAFVIAGIKRKLTWKNVKHALMETVKGTGMVYAIIICVTVFKYALTVTTIPMWLTQYVSHLGLSPLVIMIGIIALYIILGTAMEEMSMMFITIPILYPLVQSIGYDLVWFGIIVTRMMMIGGISPPLGMTMCVVQGMTKEPMKTIYKGVMPFLAADVVHVALLLAFPQIVTYLPTVIK
jgi:C4-dicarboxylate transporter, DctM subunit